MPGIMYIFKPTSPKPEIKHYAKRIIFEDIQDVVGGIVEVIAGFNTYKDEHCIAFCNEDGKSKNLPINIHATKLWAEAIGVDSFKMWPIDDLLGNVVILTGDRSFMRTL